jgi:hypothetical protein
MLMFDPLPVARSIAIVPSTRMKLDIVTNP